MLERLEVTHERTRVGAVTEPATELVGVGRGQLVVAGLGREVDGSTVTAEQLRRVVDEVSADTGIRARLAEIGRTVEGFASEDATVVVGTVLDPTCRTRCA